MTSDPSLPPASIPPSPGIAAPRSRRAARAAPLALGLALACLQPSPSAGMEALQTPLGKGHAIFRMSLTEITRTEIARAEDNSQERNREIRRMSAFVVLDKSTRRMGQVIYGRDAQRRRVYLMPWPLDGRGEPLYGNLGMQAMPLYLHLAPGRRTPVAFWTYHDAIAERTENGSSTLPFFTASAQDFGRARATSVRMPLGVARGPDQTEFQAIIAPRRLTVRGAEIGFNEDANSATNYIYQSTFGSTRRFFSLATSLTDLVNNGPNPGEHTRMNYGLLLCIEHLERTGHVPGVPVL